MANDKQQKQQAPATPAAPTTEHTGPVDMSRGELDAALRDAPGDLVTIPRGQLDEVLDSMLDMQAEIAALKAGQTGHAAAVVDQADKTAEFDAELEALKGEFADYPLIEMFERRALVGLDANLDIRLKGEPSVLEDAEGLRCRWKLRWFNFAKEGRAQQATAEGYEKVRWDELADQESITGGARVDLFVRRGDRGLEVLCKIPRKLYDYKKRRDAARAAGLLSSESGLRDHQANTVAAMVGARGGNADQAGSFVKGLSMTITPTKTERFTP